MTTILLSMGICLSLNLTAEYRLSRDHTLSQHGFSLDRWLVIISKLSTSALMVGFFFYLSPSLETFGLLIAAGLICSALGDAFLLRRHHRLALLGGIACFALAHIAYSLAFLQRPLSLIATLFLAAIMFVGAWRIYRWLKPQLPEGFGQPVFIYSLLLSVMVILGGGVSFASGQYWLASGSLLFAISDILVSRNRFVSPGYINRLFGLPLYYLGQLLIAYGAITSSAQP